MFNYFFSQNKEVKGKTDLVLYFAILAYIVSLFIKDIPVITNILMVLIFTLSLITISKENLAYALKKNKILIGIVLFFFLFFISMLLSEDKKEGMALIVRRIPLLLIPLSFFFINYKKETWDKITLFYALTTTIATIFGFSYGVYCYYISKDSGFLYNDNISEILGKQAVYLAFYVSVAIVIYVIQLNQNTQIGKKNRGYLFVAVLWLFFIIFMLASRAAMLGLLLVFFYAVSYSIIRKKKYLEGILFVFCLVIGIVIMGKLFPKTLNRFNGTTETNFQFDNKNVENHFNAEYDESKWNGTNTRMAIWKCAFEVWKANPLIGTGVGDKTKDLNKRYEENKFWYGLNTNKNTHNQYLDILISMGIIGELLFIILFFIYPVFTFFRQKQTLGVIVLILLAICLFTENMFDRYQGLIFIPFILSLASKSFDERDDTIKVHSPE